MTTLTPYESQQLARLRAWQAEPPGIATRGFAKVAAPLGNAAQKLIPDFALRGALETVQAGAARIADRRSLLRAAGIDDLSALRSRELELCDRLALRTKRRAMLLAGSSGAAFGIAGGFGLVADVPTLLLQTFRVIHRLGLCYGDVLEAPHERRLPIAVFALASANTVEEKRAALAAIDHDSQATAWREGVERAAQRQLAKDAAIFSLKNLAKTLTEHLGIRKAAGSLPLAGALVGGGVNAWFLHDVSQAAQTSFQLRWLRAKYGEIDAAGIPALTQA